MEPGEGRGHISLRTGGASSRGSDAPRGNPSRGGDVGFCGCCARITRVAVSIIYYLGENDWLKRNGVSLSKRLVPMGPLYPAARHYRNTNGTPPTHWAAEARDLPVPDPPSESVPPSSPVQMIENFPGAGSTLEDFLPGDLCRRPWIRPPLARIRDPPLRALIVSRRRVRQPPLCPARP